MAVTVEVEIHEFDDHELLEECRRRGLIPSLPEGNEPIDVDDLAQDAQAYLLANRPGKAKECLERAVWAMFPPELREAYAAIQAGRNSDAVCLLDKVFRPAPSASASFIPDWAKPQKEELT